MAIRKLISVLWFSTASRGRFWRSQSFASGRTRRARRRAGHVAARRASERARHRRSAVLALEVSQELGAA